MINPDTYKAAGLEYSLMRPILFPQQWTPTPGVLAQTLPDGVVGVEAINFGLYVSFGELFTTGDASSLWSVEGNTLYINPAPVSGDSYLVVWQKVHLPVTTIDPNTQAVSVAFPTIPLWHLPYVDMLEQAIINEAKATQIEQGPIIYQVGQTVVNRVTAAGGLRTEARELRERVRAALERPVASAPVGGSATPVSLTAS